MKVIAHCTEKYTQIFERYFKASAPSSFDIVFKPDDAAFRDQHFESERALTVAYTNYIYANMIQEIENHIGEVIVYTGVDLQFFADVTPELTEMIKDNDVLFINDVGCRCVEFLTVRCSALVADTFREVMRLYNQPGSPNDSIVLSGMKLPFRYAMLPQSYWTIGYCTMRGAPVEVPDDLKVHHANYVVGLDLKLFTLDSVREKAAKKGILWASEQEAARL